MSRRRHTVEFEGQGESIVGKLFLCYGDSSMSFSSNLFLFHLVFSFKELKLFLDGSIRRVVERCSYMILFFETFVIVLNGVAPFENHFLNVKVQLETLCDHKFLLGLEFLKAFLIENILGFQFYHLHFKESMVLLVCEHKKKDCFGVLKSLSWSFCENHLEKRFCGTIFEEFC
ncbi:hypothetical protein M9H77_21160 [Catharanthus roseus]|uniref:Uncharacterized protein n=1 Tax=Catharanthus roseus TaxID=4058 RepID=A0ACC0AN06_CATRO|nr:hypothetical protein M9H77_21160 [Catharanthus roseus]